MNPNVIFWVSLAATLLGGIGLGGMIGMMWGLARRPVPRLAHRAPRPPAPAAGNLASRWENMPEPRRPRRHEDTLDAIGDGYQAGLREGMRRRGQEPWMTQVGSQQPPGTYGQAAPRPPDPMTADYQDKAALYPQAPEEPRSVLEALGVEPGRLYPGGGWNSGPMLDEPGRDGGA